jgi:thiol-disulfide isomerase/thioredoxin
MVKRVGIDDLPAIAKEAAVTVAMFYSKGCPVCKRQEEDLDALENELGKQGVRVVKLNVAKGDLLKRLDIQQVPTLMLWIRGGINVGIRFEPGGEVFEKITYRVDGGTLREKVVRLLREDVR